MSNKIYIDARYGFREDSLENWETINPVLERGEPSIVRDGKDGKWLKIGDGVTPWNDLPYKLGPVGPQGPQGDPGVAGKDAVTDQTYSPTSPNAQSGIAVAEAVSDKQDSLVSGTNIKTINNQSILGSGNIIIEGGSGSSITIDQTFDPDSENAQSGKAVAEAVAPISGDYELIEEFTLTEDTEQIVRNQEPNGKPYAFKNLLVFISLNQTINSTIITRYVFNKNGFQPYAFNPVNYIYFTDNVTPNYAPCTFTVEVRNRNGFYYPITTSTYSNDNIYNAKVREASIFVKDGYVKEIEFTNSTKFMSGAKIRIYGVRA